MTPAQVLVEMTLNDLRRDDAYGVFPIDRDSDVHVGHVIVDAGHVNKSVPSLTDYIAYLRRIDDDISSGASVVLYPPRLVESPFCSLASFLGDSRDDYDHIAGHVGADITRDDYDHIAGHVGADIGQGEHSFVIDIERPVDDLMHGVSEVLSLADFQRLLCDMVRAFAQLVRFVTLPESVAGNVVRSLRVLISCYRAYCGDYGNDGGYSRTDYRDDGIPGNRTHGHQSISEVS